MNQQIKQKWVEALRSGEYKQTQGRLRNHDGFCCLGVLCDVLFPEDWKFTLGRCSHNDYSHVLPPKVLREAGLQESNPIVIGYSLSAHHDSSLASYNDEGKTFEEIANIIEKRL